MNRPTTNVQSTTKPPLSRVQVESPARLHLGFVDLNGSLGRKFGSLGLAIEDLSTTVVAEQCDRFNVSGGERGRAEAFALATLDAFDLPKRLSLRVDRVIPAHAGLGSGTQLALTVAAAVAELFGVNASIRDLAGVVGRGRRSGIGVGVFETGGFVADGGHSQESPVPPVLARFDFPSEWHVVLVRDEHRQGLNGAAETTAFAALAPMSSAAADELCRLTLMGVFPALVEQDFSAFCQHIAAIQSRIGEYFGPCQGGQFTSPAVAEVMAWLKHTGLAIGLGQTSWGPTAFAFVESEGRGKAVLSRLEAQFGVDSGLQFSLHRGRNHGAKIGFSGPAEATTRTSSA